MNRDALGFEGTCAGVVVAPPLGRRPMNRGAFGFEDACAGVVVAPPLGPAVHEPGRVRVRGRLPRGERRGGSPVNRDHGGAVLGGGGSGERPNTLPVNRGHGGRL